MTSAKLTVLDVAHGNCTLIQSDKNTVMVDAAVGSFVQDTIRKLNISVINTVIVSHADADHIGGLAGLLLDESIHIETIYINSDAGRNTKTFDVLLTALQEARLQDRKTRVVSSINKDTPNIDYEDFQIEVLSPSPISCIRGIGNTDSTGKLIEANGMSVVLRVIQNNQNIALISGDMNCSSLDFIKSEGDCIKAKILVFPHHGGLPADKDPVEFAKEISNLVEPELIIFSNSRSRYDNPKKEIITGISESDHSPKLACTQLSKGCHNDDENLSSNHLITSYPSRGSDKNHSCAGTIHIALNGENTDLQTPLRTQTAYIEQFADRKCKNMTLE